MNDATPNGNGDGNGHPGAPFEPARPADRVLDRLARRGLEPEETGPGQWRSRCPAHAGSSKNLSIREAADGTVLLHCHHADDGRPTCDARAIAAALELELHDLFAGPRPGAKAAKGRKEKPAGDTRPVAPMPAAVNRIRPHATPGEAVAGVARKLGPPTARWIYRDAEGFELMRAYRFDPEGGRKQFRPVHRDADGWRMGDPPGPLPLYRLDDLAEDPGETVFVLEGEKCADLAAALGLTATTSAHGAKSAERSDWSPLAGRDVVIVPDRDGEGANYANAVAAILHRLEPPASSRILELPAESEGDDIAEWLASLPVDWSAADRRAELLRLATLAPPWEPPPAKPAPPNPIFGNFSCRIVREVVRHDDAAEPARRVEVEAVHADGTRATAVVKAEEFESMAWVTSQLGLKFLLSTNPRVKDHFQHAIRAESYERGVEVVHVHESLGWRSIDGRDVYLHAGGGIGKAGPVDVEVDVRPELRSLRLPDPEPAKLPEAVRRVLRILDRLGRDAEPVAAVVLAMATRAVMGPSRLTPHFAGTTGTYKTTTACLAQRFFAPGLGYDDPMPLSWSSTIAGQEALRHAAKDALVVVDNLIADGADAPRELAKADWFFNSQGDLAGKNRMRADGTASARLDPRGSAISTGECEPRRKSALARAFVVEFRPGLIDLAGCAACHDDAAEGWYAQATACYLMHLAAPGRLADARAQLKQLAACHSAEARKVCEGPHARHAEGVAELVAGFELFTRFAVEARALEPAAAARAVARVKAGLYNLLHAQGEIQEESDPGEVFLELLASLLGSKRAALVGTDGLAPPREIAPACGWELAEVPVGRGDVVRDWQLLPGATRIGWVDDEAVYLDPNLAHSAVEKLARELGRAVGGPRQVLARLAETGKIRVETSGGRKRRAFTLKRTVEGHSRRVVVMARDLLIESADLPDPGGNSATGGTDAQNGYPY